MYDKSPTTLSARLRRLLFELAKAQEQLAAEEAAATPYWRPHPPAVLGHRAAAAALREQAELLGSSLVGSPS
jgi:hypothetical protein